MQSVRWADPTCDRGSWHLNRFDYFGSEYYRAGQAAACPCCALSFRLPLGEPNNPALHHKIISAALALLQDNQPPPILETFTP